MEIYLVGGAVRDALLNRPVGERDWVVVGATPQHLEQLGYQQVGKHFPVFIHPTTGEEYALARTERKVGHGYYGFTCYSAPDVTLEEDLLRRDLTINAMAQTEQGQLIDPFGGQRDLQARVLRHVSPAFSEDPVRVLRIARFAARYAPLGFRVAPETLQLMREMVEQGEVAHLVSERVWQELQRTLTEPTPSAFFRVLRGCGACEVIFPEIDALFGVPNAEEWHASIDTGEHTLQVIDAAACTQDASVVFATLMHDVGKALTPKELWPQHPGYEAAGVPVVQAVCQRLRVPNDYQALAMLACRYHSLCHRATTLSATELLHTLEALDVFRRPARLTAFLAVARADASSYSGEAGTAYPQADYLWHAYLIAKAIPIDAVLSAGYTGSGIAEELRRRRVEALASQVINRKG